MTGLCRKSIGCIAMAAILAASLMTTGCGFFPPEEEALPPPLMKPAKIEYQTQAITRGSLSLQLRLAAIFYPEIQKSLSFEKQGGRLKALYVTYGQVVKAGDLIAELDADSLVSSVRIQELEVEKSKLALAKLQADRADAYSIKRADLDLQQQEFRLEDMNRQLAATRVFAPIDGKLVYLIGASVGENINAYQTVAKVADTGSLLLKTTSTTGAAELPIGAQVTVEYLQQVLDGTVVANPSTLISDPDESMRKAALIRIQGALPKDVSLGAYARIVFVKEKRENVLFLPLNLINLMSGRRYVNVLVDGIRVEKDVEIGLQTDTEAELVKGVAEGDLVIVN